MKKNITIVITLVIGVLFCYLLFKVWNIFGFWTLMWTGILASIVNVLLGQLIGSRNEKNGLVTYNPKEWPKLLGMLVSLGIGYYLFTIVNKSELSSYDRFFGLAYLILLTAVPLMIAIYKLIRDRNDFISLDDKFLKYRDNNESGEFEISLIIKVELAGGIKLTFKDETTFTIQTANMNFNTKDLTGVLYEIKAKLPTE